MSGATETPVFETHRFLDDGVVPNNPALPLVHYRGVLPEGDDRASYCEKLFAAHGWPDAWRNGIYGHHHYHSTAHEVLGIYEGRVTARLGGGRGVTVTLVAGDVAVIPAGVAHKNDGASPDFRVVGAYPVGTGPDMQYGKPGERPGTDRNIARVGIPAADPVRGGGAIALVWKTKPAK